MPSSKKTVQLKDIPRKRSPDRPKSRNSKSSTTTTSKKEAAVLSDGSLALLAREIGREKYTGLALAMCLNIPTTAIVMAANGASECGLIGASETTKADLTTKLLLDWKTKKPPSVKDKEKVRDLERAVKEIGRTDIADMIQEKFTSNTELTADALASLQ